MRSLLISSLLLLVCACADHTPLPKNAVETVHAGMAAAIEHIESRGFSRSSNVSLVISIHEELKRAAESRGSEKRDHLILAARSMLNLIDRDEKLQVQLQVLIPLLERMLK